MKKFSSVISLAVLVLMFASCDNQGYKRTKSGLLYKIITDGKTPVARKGEFLKVYSTTRVRDSVLFTNNGSLPGYYMVDSVGLTYDPTEIFRLLRKGDSVATLVSADSLERKSGQPLPPFIKKKDKVMFALKVIDILPSRDAVIADRNNEINKQKDKEIAQVEKYLSDKKISAQKTEKGTYFVVDAKGDGPAVDSGKRVSVRYTGKLIPSGKIFETNANPGNQPFSFVIGSKPRGAIEGWDDGLRKFNKGGKGTLIIPAYLAYNAQQGPGGEPFESLAFDVEVVDVTDAPKPGTGPLEIPGRTRPDSIGVKHK